MSREITELSETMKRVAEEISLQSLKENKLSHDEIGEKYGVTRRTIYDWRQRPDFIAYQNAVSQMVMESVTSEVNERLIDLIRDKNPNIALKAIELHAKLQGRLSGQQTNIVIEQPAKATLIDDINELEQRIKKARTGESVDAEFEEID